ncbi:MAG: hypothetical protein AAGA56_03050 [Myxococcota bacterium]
MLTRSRNATFAAGLTLAGCNAVFGLTELEGGASTSSATDTSETIPSSGQGASDTTGGAGSPGGGSSPIDVPYRAPTAVGDCGSELPAAASEVTTSIRIINLVPEAASGMNLCLRPGGQAGAFDNYAADVASGEASRFTPVEAGVYRLRVNAGALDGEPGNSGNCSDTPSPTTDEIDITLLGQSGARYTVVVTPTTPRPVPILIVEDHTPLAVDNARLCVMNGLRPPDEEQKVGQVSVVNEFIEPAIEGLAPAGSAELLLDAGSDLRFGVNPDPLARGGEFVYGGVELGRGASHLMLLLERAPSPSMLVCNAGGCSIAVRETD